MKSLKALVIVAIGLSIWLGGCKVKNPGSAAGDVPPTTALSVAPLDNAQTPNDSSIVNYYVTLGWAGNDPDGTIAGFDVYVDDQPPVFTTATDTTIAFFTPRDSVATLHHIRVLAVDNSGLVDPENDTTRTRRNFYTINRTPTATVGGLANNDSVGTNFRVTVSSVSSRPSSTEYSLALDDPTAWSEWTSNSSFLFAAPEIIADTALMPPGVLGISNAGLTPGQHVVYLRAQNAGGAISPVSADTIQVGSGPDFLPIMDSTVTSTYGGVSFYPDGSAYVVRTNGQTASIVVKASEGHKGNINAYRHRSGTLTLTGVVWGDWSDWQKSAGLDTANLPAGDYPFQFMARDYSDQFTDSVSTTIHLVNQALSDSIIIACDTQDKNGNRGNASQAQVNAFYKSLLGVDSTKCRVVQVTLATDPDTSRHGQQYLSPYDVHNAGLVVWHMDYAAQETDVDRMLSRQRILTEYLGKGGRMIISGWDLITKFESVAQDSVVFTSGYAVNRLELISGWRTTSSVRQSTVIGFDGANGFPGAYVDSLKLLPNANGHLTSCWTFDPQGQDIITGLLAETDTSEVHYHRPASYLYNLSFRVAVFGVPLYFCYNDQVATLFHHEGDPTHSVLDIMMQGLSPGL